MMIQTVFLEQDSCWCYRYPGELLTCLPLFPGCPVGPLLPGMPDSPFGPISP